MSRSVLAFVSAALLAAGLLLGATHPRAPFAAASTPAPTRGPAVTVPFPLHFTTLPSGIFVGQPLELTVQAQPPAGTTVSYAWDFGDGSSTIGPTIRHAYTDAGAYTIAVTATAGEAKAVIQTSVTVNPRPAPLVLELAPGDQGQVSFFAGCPPRYYAPNLGVPGLYRAPSCGCCAPGLATMVNDAAVPVSFTYDGLMRTVILAVPAGWDVLATDFPGCVPANPDSLTVLTCPPPTVSGPLSKTLHVGAAPTGTYPSSVTYPAGWNLIAGVRLTGAEGTVYNTAAGGTFQRLQTPVLDLGSGPRDYVAYFPQPVTVPLAPRGPLGGAIQLRGQGQWLLIGNPGQVPVTVEGADAVEAYDPTTNTYVAVDVLQPGQGTWVYTGATGLITVVPQSPSESP